MEKNNLSILASGEAPEKVLVLVPIESRGADLSAKAAAIQINSTDAETQASEYWKAGNDILKEIDAEFDPVIKQAHSLHKSLVAKKAAFQEPVQALMRLLKTKVADYRKALEDERLKRERELQAAAKKLEEEKRLQEAIDLEESGDQASADLVLSQPVEAVPVVLKEAPKPKGLIVLRSNWTFRIVDEKLIPREYLMVDSSKIGKVVKALKADARIPGVEVVEEKV